MQCVEKKIILFNRGRKKTERGSHEEIIYL